MSLEVSQKDGEDIKRRQLHGSKGRRHCIDQGVDIMHLRHMRPGGDFMAVSQDGGTNCPDDCPTIVTFMFLSIFILIVQSGDQIIF